MHCNVLAYFAGYFLSTLDEVAAGEFGKIMVFILEVNHTHLASGALFPPSPPRRARSGARTRPVECFPDAAIAIRAVCRPAMAASTEPETAWEGSCQSRHSSWGALEGNIPVHVQATATAKATCKALMGSFCVSSFANVSRPRPTCFSAAAGVTLLVKF
jgi:hypothetical protein